MMGSLPFTRGLSNRSPFIDEPEANWSLSWPATLADPGAVHYLPSHSFPVKHPDDPKRRFSGGNENLVRIPPQGSILEEVFFLCKPIVEPLHH